MADRQRLRQRLRAGVEVLALDLADDAIERLLDYIELLERWNAAYNLTAVRDPEEMITRHVLDSLAITPYVEGQTLADLGSGAGLPGIPLAIVAPERDIVLVDSNGKKARFLREAIRRLALTRVRVAESRAEAVAGTFDCITARAFASLADMLEWGGHLLAPDGVWLALKGRVQADELDVVPVSFKIASVREIAVPGLDAERHVVVIKRADAAASR